MPRLHAAVTAFWAAILASDRASHRSPGPGRRGEQPPAAKASYHFWQSAQKKEHQRGLGDEGLVVAGVGQRVLDGLVGNV